MIQGISNFIDLFMNKTTSILYNMFRSNRVLEVIKYYNLIALILYVIGAIIYLLPLDFLHVFHYVCVALLGFNLFSLIPIGYIMSKFNFCEWSKMAYVSNTIICVLELLFSFIEMFYIVSWDNIIVLVVSSILLMFTIKFIKWKKSLTS